MGHNRGGLSSLVAELAILALLLEGATCCSLRVQSHVRDG